MLFIKVELKSYIIGLDLKNVKPGCYLLSTTTLVTYCHNYHSVAVVAAKNDGSMTRNVVTFFAPVDAGVVL